VLSDLPLLLDGGMGTALMERGLASGEAPERWLLEHPEHISSVHRAFVEAGCDIIQTASFGANSARLSGEPDLAGRTVELCSIATQLARQAASQVRTAPQRKVLVAGNIGPAQGWLDSDSTHEEQLFEIFAEAAQALATAGVDLLSVETMCDVREARAAVRAAHTTGLPVLASMTFSETSDGFASLAGDSLQNCLTELAHAGAAVIGLNCNLDSSQARRLVQLALPMTSLPLIVQPCAGQPTEVLGRLHYPEATGLFVTNQLAIVQQGAAIVGGCCGTSPEAIASLRKSIDELAAATPAPGEASG